jgi:protein-L-isoaspartate(D-aspartate) O-methyltransferase
MSYERERERMVHRQLRGRGIHDERVLAAMEVVAREVFVSEDERADAHADTPLPIGFGQTISQPFMVGFLCQELSVRPGHRVLDVGCGSGYQAAVLAELGARVSGIERIPELVELARSNLRATGYDDRVSVVLGDGSLGLPEEAPFDRIVVAAAAPRIPETLYGQLALNGRLLVPVGPARDQRLEVVVSTLEGPAVAHTVSCRFVKLVGAEGFEG